MKHIFKSFNFGTLDYKDGEELLNRMAEKGYEFKGTGKGWIRNVAMFEKSEKAKNLKYAIDVGKRKEHEKQTYYQFYRDLGWQKIDCFNKRLYIFATNSDNAVPLYTDGLAERKMRKKAAINNGELLDNILQLFCMLAVSSILFLSRNDIDNLIAYSFSFIYCMIMGYYALQVAAKLIYIARGWKHQNECLVPRILQIIRGCSKFIWIAFFAFIPAVSIVEFCYGIWTNSAPIGSFFGIRWQIVQLLLCIGSIPVILTATYRQALYPEKEQLKLLDFLGVFMYFCGLWNLLYFGF
ncbi:DUF2812 domain-containing protein [Aminipila terrae]|uniref:DUF2812 domain-containing protein n=1 Tax=Aminipila terrae TaxID=2697030 RepID=A0A6P1MKG0_9FIRM|nr:DUF2812 domain-containing protein [Aminipila terrae]QHI72126.1 DUF2812 domain-containing protein [Aminipila terrae]